MNSGRQRRLREFVVLAALAGMFLTGCGTAEQGAEMATLSTRLEQVDQSLSAARFTQARRDLSGLAAETREALAAGDLDAGDADRILQAIATLRATLPAIPEATQTPTATPRQSTPTTKSSSKPKHGPGKKHGKGTKG